MRVVRALGAALSYVVGGQRDSNIGSDMGDKMGEEVDKVALGCLV